MNQMTPEQYTACGGVRCPFCNSHDIEAGSTTVEQGKIYQDVECNACGKEWTDEYKLTGYVEVNA